MKTLTFFLLLASSGMIYHSPNADGDNSNHVISRVHWITINLKTPELFDSLYHLFSVELQIPVFFEPETFGKARYAGIHAGNVILEPCGPFDLEPLHGKDIQGRYNTLIFRPWKDATTSAEILEKLDFDFSSQSSPLISLTVKELCTDHLPVHLSDTCCLRVESVSRIDSLRNVLREIGGGPIRFMYIEEVHIGYQTAAYLGKWEKFLYPMPSKDNLWYTPEKPNLRFVKSEREEIKALVCKVESLRVAKNYLQHKNLLGTESAGSLELDMHKTGGLKIILVE